MKIQCSLSLAAAMLLTLSAGSALAQDGSAMPPSPMQGPGVGAAEATEMVPARAALKEDLDGKKVQAGFTFHAVLANKVKLKTGMVLPGGTVLVGQIVADDMQIAGSSVMALRFISANLKDGQTIPIKATIVEIVKPESVQPPDSSVRAGDQVPNNWNARITKVDQTDVVKGVDLHSSIASKNSGVLVSTTAKTVKLGVGSEFALAIGTVPATQAAAAGMTP